MATRIRRRKPKKESLAVKYQSLVGFHVKFSEAIAERMDGLLLASYGQIVSLREKKKSNKYIKKST